LIILVATVPLSALVAVVAARLYSGLVMWLLAIAEPIAISYSLFWLCVEMGVISDESGSWYPFVLPYLTIPALLASVCLSWPSEAASKVAFLRSGIMSIEGRRTFSPRGA
jgi:hypothetical protein